MGAFSNLKKNSRREDICHFVFIAGDNLFTGVNDILLPVSFYWYLCYQGTRTVPLYVSLHREMENISRGPIFEDFVTILTEGSMQDVIVATLQTKRGQTPLSPLY